MNSPPADFRHRVLTVLDEVRPMLRMDGGDIELVDVDPARGRVEVRLTGACSHCASSLQTLALGVEARLKQAIPAVLEVVAI